MKFLELNTDEKRVVIIGAGFAGIRAALNLAKNKLPHVKITLISNKHHFEYYPRIYRVVTGESPLEVCVRLDEIFMGRDVDVVVDSVTSIDTANKKVIGKSGSEYLYTDLVMALGSETAYFGIEGVKERAYGFKSIEEALRLKAHLHEMFDKYLGHLRYHSHYSHQHAVWYRQKHDIWVGSYCLDRLLIP